MPSERTLASIRLQGLREQSIITRGVEFYSCGCDRFLADDGRDERWHLCPYHEGFDDAAEQAADETERLRRYADQQHAEHMAALLKLDELQALIDAYAKADAEDDINGYGLAYRALLAAATKEDDRA